MVRLLNPFQIRSTLFPGNTTKLIKFGLLNPNYNCILSYKYMLQYIINLLIKISYFVFYKCIRKLEGSLKLMILEQF